MFKNIVAHHNAAHASNPQCSKRIRHPESFKATPENQTSDKSLQCVLLQFFDIPVDSMQLCGNVNALRAMRTTLVATYAMRSLPQFRDTSIVTDKKRPPRFPIILILRIYRHISFIKTFVVMQQNSRNINSIRTWHTIFAIVARHGVKLHHPVGHPLKKSKLFFAQSFQRAICAQIVFQVLHACHSAQHSQHPRETAGKAECP